MNQIAIYVEGGGDTAQQKAELRVGFDALLDAQKQVTRDKRLRWKLVPSGSRNNAYSAFVDAVRRADSRTICVLLVDAEDPLPPGTNGRPDANAKVRKDHLASRDGWDLGHVVPERIHLMVQCMETWIVADSGALANYYGKGFRARSLPVREDLEEEPKLQVYDKLTKATKNSSKGAYSKIKHAGRLLGLIDPIKVATRCARFRTFTEWLEQQIRNV